MNTKEFLVGTEAEREAANTMAGLKLRRETNGRLRPREQKRLAEAAKTVRRRSLRQAATAIAITSAIAGGTIGLAGKQKPKPDAVGSGSIPAHTEPNKPARLALRIADGAFWGEEKVAAMRQAAQDWFGKFGCGRSVTISPYRHQDKKVYDTGRVDTTLEVTTPGKMQVTNTSDLTETRNTVLHAMTHACQNRVNLKEPISFHDGQITGYQGLSLLVRLKDGTNTQFQAFEEAFAEREASQFKDYNVSDINYYAVGKHALSAFPVDEYPDAYKWVQTSDVPAFIRAELHMSPAQPVTGPAIEQVMSTYNQLFHGY